MSLFLLGQESTRRKGGLWFTLACMLSIPLPLSQRSSPKIQFTYTRSTFQAPLRFPYLLPQWFLHHTLIQYLLRTYICCKLCKTVRTLRQEAIQDPASGSLHGCLPSSPQHPPSRAHCSDPVLFSFLSPVPLYLFQTVPALKIYPLRVMLSASWVTAS